MKNKKRLLCAIAAVLCLAVIGAAMAFAANDQTVPAAEEARPVLDYAEIIPDSGEPEAAAVDAETFAEAEAAAIDAETDSGDAPLTVEWEVMYADMLYDAPPPHGTRELTVSVGELIYPRPAVSNEMEITIEQLRFVVSPMSAKLYMSFAPGKEKHTGLNINGTFLTLTDGREIPLVHRGDLEDQQNPENSYGFYIHEYIDPDSVTSVTLWDVIYPFGS
jgi:hypothetical protein